MNIISRVKLQGNIPFSTQLSILLSIAFVALEYVLTSSIYGINKSGYVLSNEGRKGSLNHRRIRTLRTC